MPSSQTVQAPQSPWSQPFLTPNHPCSRKNVRRHWPGAGSAESLLPLTVRFMRDELRPDLLGVVIGEVALIGRRAVHVVEPVVGLDGASIARRSAPADGRRSKWSCIGLAVAAVMVSVKSSPVLLRVPTTSAAERPRWVSELRRKAKRFSSALAGR